MRSPRGLGKATDYAVSLTRRRLLGSSLATAVALGSCGRTTDADVGTRPSSSKRRDTVILVVFDELGGRGVLGRGHIDSSSFPNFAALSREGSWIENASSNFYDTCRAVPTLLSGHLAGRENCDGYRLGTEATSLFNSVRPNYDVAAYGEYFADCIGAKDRTCYGPTDLNAERPDIRLLAHWTTRGIRRLVAPGLVDESFSPYSRTLFDRFLADLRQPTAIGRFFFLHILLPHGPYVFDRDGHVVYREQVEFARLPEDDAFVFQSYLEQTRYVDYLLGRLMNRLKEQQLYESCTLIVTGDHGPRPPQSYLETNTTSVGTLTPYVALLIRSPLLGSLASAAYSHVDLAPSVIKLLGLPRPAGMTGRDDFGAGAGDRVRTFGWRNREYNEDAGSGRWLAAR